MSPRVPVHRIQIRKERSYEDMEGSCGGTGKKGGDS